MILALLLVLAVLIPSLAEATTYYTSNSTANSMVVGNNANNCTATSTPCLTMAGGIGKMSSGDTLIVNDGSYTESNLGDTIPSGGGTDETRTIVTCYSRRGCTLTSSASHNFRFMDSDTNWITLKWFVLISTATVNVALNSTTSYPNQTWPHHIRLEDNEIKNSPIYCLYTGYGQFNEFLYNDIHACGEQGVYSLMRDGIFRGNTIYQIGTAAVSGKRQAYQQGTGGGLTPGTTVIEENIFRNNPETCVEIFGGSGHTIRRNVFYSCVSRGLNATTGDIDNSTIDHNVFYGNGVGLNITNTFSTGNVCRNNIAIGNTTNINIVGSTCPQTDNLTTGTATDIFVSPTTGDFRLKSGSAAIDGGTDISQIFNGAAPDQGAFETFAFTSCVVEDATPTHIYVTFANDVQPPLLPATGVTGFTARKAAANDVITSAIRKSGANNIIDLTLTDAIVNGNAVDISYSAGNLTDSSLVGNSYNQTYLATLTNQSCTNNVGAAPSSAVLTQKYFRFHGLYGTEAAPIVKSIGGAINANAYSVPGGKIRIRIKVACTIAGCAALGMVLRYSLNSGSYTAVPDTFGADNIRYYATVNVDIPTSGTATTELLTSDHATNITGALIRSAAAIPTVDLSQNSEVELEYAIEFDTDAVVNDTYDFRLYDQSGTALTTYTVTPRLTVVPMAAGGGF